MSAQDEELIYLIEHFWSPMHWRLRGAVIKRVTAMQQENATLRARVAELEARDDSDKSEYTSVSNLPLRVYSLDEDVTPNILHRDDSDKSHAANCPNCGAPMQVVRPGDARCSAECYIKPEG